MDRFLHDITEITRHPYLLVILLAALTFDFINGFHDAANSIATVVGTRVLRPVHAVAWAAWWNFAAAWFFGVQVANTVGKMVQTAFVTEDVIFAGLLGAFLVYRTANETWPPMSMPRLPVEVTGINTLILLYSASTMWRANRAIRLGEQQQLRRMLLHTAVLGMVFLTIQGYEWAKLIGYGLTLSSGVYGATFYTLIGCHGLHVLGAVVWLCSVWLRATHQRYTATRRTGVVLCGMYWSYVVGLWPVLYWLVYLY